MIPQPITQRIMWAAYDPETGNIIFASVQATKYDVKRIMKVLFPLMKKYVVSRIGVDIIPIEL